MSARTERQAWLERACGPGGSLDPWGRYATLNDPEHFLSSASTDNRELSIERAALHKQVYAEFEDSQPRIGQQRVALLLTGPPAAGKTTIAHQVLTESGLSMDRFRHIDANEFTDRLLDTLAVTGRLNELVPEQLRAYGPMPRELGGLVQREAGLLTAAALDSALRRGDNVVVDSPGGSIDRAHQVVGALQEARYQVHLVSVDASRPDSLDRAMHRHWVQHASARNAGNAAAGFDRLGGRFTPSAAIDRLYDDRGGCIPTAVGRELAQTEPAIRSYRLFRVTAGVPAPQLDEVRGASMEQPIPAAAFQAMRAADLTQGIARRGRFGSRPQAGARRRGHDQSRRDLGSDGPER